MQPKEAINCLNQAIDIYTDMVRLLCGVLRGYKVYMFITIYFNSRGIIAESRLNRLPVVNLIIKTPCGVILLVNQRHSALLL